MEEEEAIEGIRESSRNLLLMNRRQKRDAVTDEKRPLPNLRPNPDAVTQLANKLKTKSAVTAAELRALKNSLIDDAANIEVITEVLIHFPGHGLNKQYEAIGCCCNLGLGDAKAGLAVAKSAGPYLIAALDSLNADLAISSAWALGNLAGSGPKASEVLMAQGCVARLTHLLVCNYEDLRESVLYALVHLCNQLKDNLPLIANMNCVYTFNKFLSYFVDNDKMNVLKKLLETDQVNESVLWLLGNAYKCCSEHMVFKLLLR
ncbi:hypothetical protein HF086_013509 [Spodoptera exigua]|uniref:Uncharacterized protein n=1 Tax=Spodoptera exigua TaxID=7107 RepID=A0A922M6C6_SPOEX|nr:hypothetical protein HF086_013509 [Spodoptera exigua]